MSGESWALVDELQSSAKTEKFLEHFNRLEEIKKGRASYSQGALKTHSQTTSSAETQRTSGDEREAHIARMLERSRAAGRKKSGIEQHRERASLMIELQQSIRNSNAMVDSTNAAIQEAEERMGVRQPSRVPPTELTPVAGIRARLAYRMGIQDVAPSLVLPVDVRNPTPIKGLNQDKGPSQGKAANQGVDAAPVPFMCGHVHETPEACEKSQAFLRREMQSEGIDDTTRPDESLTSHGGPSMGEVAGGSHVADMRRRGVSANPFTELKRYQDDGIFAATTARRTRPSRSAHHIAARERCTPSRSHVSSPTDRLVQTRRGVRRPTTSPSHICGDAIATIGARIHGSRKRPSSVSRKVQHDLRQARQELKGAHWTGIPVAYGTWAEVGAIQTTVPFRVRGSGLRTAVPTVTTAPELAPHGLESSQQQCPDSTDLAHIPEEGPETAGGALAALVVQPSRGMRSTV